MPIFLIITSLGARIAALLTVSAVSLMGM